jgi:hypothetical protein
MYSAHDRNLADVETYLMGVFNLPQNKTHFPSYASSILIELYSKDYIKDYAFATEDDYYVTITMNDFVLLNLTFIEFKTNVLTKSYNMEKTSEFCGWPDPNPPKPSPSPSPPVPPKDDSFNYFILTTILFGILALLQFVYICYQKRFIKAGVNVGANVNVSNYNAIM